MALEPLYYINPAYSGVGFLCSIMTGCFAAKMHEGDVIIAPEQVEESIRAEGRKWNVMHVHRTIEVGRK